MLSGSATAASIRTGAPASISPPSVTSTLISTLSNIALALQPDHLDKAALCPSSINNMPDYKTSKGILTLLLRSPSVQVADSSHLVVSTDAFACGK